MTKYIYSFLLIFIHILSLTLNIEAELVKKNGTSIKIDLKDLLEQYQIVLNTNTSNDIITLIRKPSNSSLKSVLTIKANVSLIKFNTSTILTSTKVSTNLDNKKPRTLPKIIDTTPITISSKQVSTKVSASVATSKLTSKSTKTTTTTTTTEAEYQNEYQNDLVTDEHETSDNFQEISSQTEYFQDFMISNDTSTDYSENELIDTNYRTTTLVIEPTTTFKSSKSKTNAPFAIKTVNTTQRTAQTTTTKQPITTFTFKTTNTNAKSSKTNLQFTNISRSSSTKTSKHLSSSSLSSLDLAKINQTTSKSTSKLNSTSTTLTIMNSTTTTKNKSTQVTQTQRPKNSTTSPLSEPLTECPKNFENYCLNSAECFMKSFKSDFIEILDNNHTLVHSKIPNCRCKHFYKLYGLIIVSYHGLRCETQINSFTYMSMSLIAVSILVLIIFVILLCIFFIYPKRRNTEYPSFSIEYHNKLYRPRKTLNTKNKLSDTDWMQKFRTIRNSWKYINIKMNRSKGRSSGKKKKAAAHFRKNGEETELQSISNNNNNNKSLKRFLPKKTTNLLQNSAATLSTVSLIGQSSSRSDEIDGSDENFLFSNKNNEVQQTSGISLPPTYNSSAPLNANSLDTKVPSNINVYPKPSRLSNENRFSSNKQEENKESTLLY